MLNLDSNETEHFTSLAASWWDRDGPCRTLHDINPCRLEYVRGGGSLAGKQVADIGCGGGLLSEAMARDGARVTAIDASEVLIATAREHAAAAHLDIDYRAMLSRELAESAPARFDLVTCLELIEHVPDADALLADCAALLRPGGTLVLSTLNRNPQAWLLGIVAAEYVLGLVPRGTHDYQQFIRPSELAASARRHGLELRDVSGMHYNPVTRRARSGGPPRVNYLARFVRRDDLPA